MSGNELTASWTVTILAMLISVVLTLAIVLISPKRELQIGYFFKKRFGPKSLPIQTQTVALEVSPRDVTSKGPLSEFDSEV